MVEKTKVHFAWNEVKTSIIKFVLESSGPVTEPAIREHLLDIYGAADQGLINRQLRTLKSSGCIEKVAPVKKSRLNYWNIKKLKNLENILIQYPDLVEILQNSEHALDIVLISMIAALTTYVKPEYKEIEEINQYLAPIRADLMTKLKMSASFFKLCITTEYDMYRNFSDLSEISDGGPHAHIFVIDDVPSVFVKSALGADVAFKSCISLEIMKRKGDSRKSMKDEIEYIQKMNNVVLKEQLNKLKKYYEKTQVAPAFLKDTKFISVRNDELAKLQEKFEDKGGKWDYLKDDEEPDGPA